MKFLLLFSLMFFFHASIGLAATPVRVKGEADMGGRTPDEARDEALRRAKEKAVETACGVRLQAETFLKDHLLSGDFVHAVTYGHLVEERILREGVSAIPRPPGQPPSLLYEVELETWVECEKGEPDPAYQVSLELNQKVYRPGEEMVLKVRGSREGYLTVLNFAADNRVYVLFPSALRRENRLRGDEEIEIPSPSDREAGLRFRISGLPGKKKLSETILVIVTRSRLDLLRDFRLKGDFASFETPHLAATEVARWLSQIPFSDRAWASRPYLVVSGD